MKTDETCRFETTEPRNSTDHRSGLSLSVARGNSYHVWWAPDAFGLIRKKECQRAVQNQPVSEVNKFIAERARLLGP